MHAINYVRRIIIIVDFQRGAMAIAKNLELVLGSRTAEIK
jgi:hypothetical protein